MVAIIALGVVVFNLAVNSGKKAKYEDLLSNITAAGDVFTVTLYEDDLQTFESENPKMVPADLSSLMQICVDYAEASTDDETRYTDAISGLESLSASSVPEVASAATELLADIEVAYQDYQDQMAAMEEGGGVFGGDLPTTATYDPATSPLPTSGNGLGVLDTMDGEAVFSFTAQNTSDKTVDYFEVIAFYYDKDGNPLADEDGLTWEYRIDDNSSIAPGSEHNPRNNGYWGITSHGDAAYVVPVVIYAEFDDGTSWGEWIFSAPDQAFVDAIQPLADATVAAAR